MDNKVIDDFLTEHGALSNDMQRFAAVNPRVEESKRILVSKGPVICRQVLGRVVVQVQGWGELAKHGDANADTLLERGVANVSASAWELFSVMLSTWKAPGTSAKDLMTAELLATLVDDDRDIRILGVVYCATLPISSSMVEPFLALLLTQDKDALVKIAAAAALEYLGTRDLRLHESCASLVDYYMANLMSVPPPTKVRKLQLLAVLSTLTIHVAIGTVIRG